MHRDEQGWHDGRLQNMTVSAAISVFSLKPSLRGGPDLGPTWQSKPSTSCIFLDYFRLLPRSKIDLLAKTPWINTNSKTRLLKQRAIFFVFHLCKSVCIRGKTCLSFFPSKSIRVY